MSPEFEKLILKIAQKHFGVETLETQNRDRLDFKEVSVQEIKAALAEAFKLGVEYGYEVCADGKER
jgi:anti-sigma regulatory factor (Ser/Thr protein kinase)